MGGTVIEEPDVKVGDEKSNSKPERAPRLFSLHYSEGDVVRYVGGSRCKWLEEGEDLEVAAVSVQVRSRRTGKTTWLLDRYLEASR